MSDRRPTRRESWPDDHEPPSGIFGLVVAFLCALLLGVLEWLARENR